MDSLLNLSEDDYNMNQTPRLFLEQTEVNEVIGESPVHGIEDYEDDIIPSSQNEFISQMEKSFKISNLSKIEENDGILSFSQDDKYANKLLESEKNKAAEKNLLIDENKTPFKENIPEQINDAKMDKKDTQQKKNFNFKKLQLSRNDDKTDDEKNTPVFEDKDLTAYIKKNFSTPQISTHTAMPNESLSSIEANSKNNSNNTSLIIENDSKFTRKQLFLTEVTYSISNTNEAQPLMNIINLNFEELNFEKSDISSGALGDISKSISPNSNVSGPGLVNLNRFSTLSNTSRFSSLSRFSTSSSSSAMSSASVVNKRLNLRNSIFVVPSVPRAIKEFENKILSEERIEFLKSHWLNHDQVYKILDQIDLANSSFINSEHLTNEVEINEKNVEISNFDNQNVEKDKFLEKEDIKLKTIETILEAETPKSTTKKRGGGRRKKNDTETEKSTSKKSKLEITSDKTSPFVENKSNDDIEKLNEIPKRTPLKRSGRRKKNENIETENDLLKNAKKSKSNDEKSSSEEILTSSLNSVDNFDQEKSDGELFKHYNIKTYSRQPASLKKTNDGQKKISDVQIQATVEQNETTSVEIETPQEHLMPKRILTPRNRRLGLLFPSKDEKIINKQKENIETEIDLSKNEKKSKSNNEKLSSEEILSSSLKSDEQTETTADEIEKPKENLMSKKLQTPRKPQLALFPSKDDKMINEQKDSSFKDQEKLEDVSTNTRSSGRKIIKKSTSQDNLSETIIASNKKKLQQKKSSKQLGVNEEDDKKSDLQTQSLKKSKKEKNIKLDSKENSDTGEQIKTRRVGRSAQKSLNDEKTKKSEDNKTAEKKSNKTKSVTKSLKKIKNVDDKKSSEDLKSNETRTILKDDDEKKIIENSIKAKNVKTMSESNRSTKAKRKIDYPNEEFNSPRSYKRLANRNISFGSSTSSAQTDCSNETLDNAEKVTNENQLVFARWQDGKYYSGVIQNENNQIKFDFGDELILEPKYILPNCHKSLINCSVYALIDQNTKDYQSGMVRDVVIKDGVYFYTVDLDIGSMINCQSKDLYLTEDQTETVREILSEFKKVPTSRTHTPKTPKNSTIGEISLDNVILMSSRSSRSRVQKTTDSPRPGCSNSNTPKVKKEKSDLESSSSQDELFQNKIDWVEGLEYEPALLMQKSTGKRSKPRTPQRNNEDENLLGPLPESNKIFDKMNFLLTFSNENVVVKRKKFSDTSETEGDSENEQFSNVPFVEDRLIEQIKLMGGKVFNTFEEIPSDEYSKSYLIANRPSKTAKYLQCLAANIKILSHSWVIKCCQEKKLVALVYLPNGWSIEKNCFIETKSFYNSQENQAVKPLKNLIILIASKNEKFSIFWSRICSLAGAKTIIINKPQDLTPLASAMIVDSNYSLELMIKAKSLEVPVLTTTWIVQTLVHGEQRINHAHSLYNVCNSFSSGSE